MRSRIHFINILRCSITEEQISAIFLIIFLSHLVYIKKIEIKFGGTFYKRLTPRIVQFFMRLDSVGEEKNKRLIKGFMIALFDPPIGNFLPRLR